MKVVSFALLSTSLLVAACTSSTKDSGSTQDNRYRAYYGEDLYRGLIFADGEVAERIPQISKVQSVFNVALLSADERKFVKDVESSIIDKIKAGDSTFFLRFQENIQSGNQVKVSKAMEEAEGITARILSEANKQLALIIDDKQDTMLMGRLTRSKDKLRSSLKANLSDSSARAGIERFFEDDINISIARNNNLSLDLARLRDRHLDIDLQRIRQIDQALDLQLQRLRNFQIDLNRIKDIDINLNLDLQRQLSVNINDRACAAVAVVLVIWRYLAVHDQVKITKDKLEFAFDESILAREQFINSIANNLRQTNF